MSLSLQSRILLPGLVGVFLVSGLLGEDGFNGFSGESSLSVGYGYAENVLYSELAPLDSAFTFVGVEGAAKRILFDDLTTWESMLYAEKRFFASLTDVPNQKLALAQSELSRYAGLFSKWTVGGRYLTLTQAFDATFDIEERNSFLVDASQIEGYLGFESFWGNYAYELEIGVSEMSFDTTVNDFETVDFELEVNRDLSDSLIWVSEINGYKRAYDTRLARDEGGSALEGELLTMTRLGFETGVEYAFGWGKASHRFDLRWTYRERRDADFGYYDRVDEGIELQWEVEAGKNELAVILEYENSAYALQKTDSAELEKSDAWLWSIEYERLLNEHLSLFAFVEGESENSNASFASYESRSVWLGLKWYP